MNKPWMTHMRGVCYAQCKGARFALHVGHHLFLFGSRPGPCGLRVEVLTPSVRFRVSFGGRHA